MYVCMFYVNPVGKDKIFVYIGNVILHLKSIYTDVSEKSNTDTVADDNDEWEEG